MNKKAEKAWKGNWAGFQAVDLSAYNPGYSLSRWDPSDTNAIWSDTYKCSRTRLRSVYKFICKKKLFGKTACKSPVQSRVMLGGVASLITLGRQIPEALIKCPEERNKCYRDQR